MNARNFFREYVTSLQTVLPKEASIKIAEMAFEHFAGITRRNMMLSADASLTNEQILKLQYALKRLLLHEPIQYVTGIAWFYEMAFDVSPAVLIPRPETEELVEQVIQHAQHRSSIHILEVGTGSGCIAVTVKKYLPKANITAVDISAEALQIAQQNATKHQTSIHFIEMNFLDENARSALDKYHLIVSNPPYIPFAEKNTMDENVISFEPHLALFADDHLVFYKALAKFGKHHLEKEGVIFCEVHQTYASEVQKVMEDANYTAEVLKDISGNNRMVKATLNHSL